ncbi:hypothetical protein LTR17_026308 [Elasticomyces elasticus]|nr:hypothetical protein LTR17_026308 [Elasticomyces elasticus]
MPHLADQAPDSIANASSTSSENYCLLTAHHKLTCTPEQKIAWLKAQTITIHRAYMRSCERLLAPEDLTPSSRDDLNAATSSADSETSVESESSAELDSNIREIAVQHISAVAQNLHALDRLHSKFSDVVLVRNLLVWDYLQIAINKYEQGKDTLLQSPQSDLEELACAFKEMDWHISMIERGDHEEATEGDGIDCCLEALEPIEELLGCASGTGSSEASEIEQPADIVMDESSHDLVQPDNEQQLLQPPQHGNDDESTDSLRLKYCDAEAKITAALDKANANLRASRTWHSNAKKRYFAASPVTHADLLRALPGIERDTEVAKAMSTKVVP